AAVARSRRAAPADGRRPGPAGRDHHGPSRRIAARTATLPGTGGEWRALSRGGTRRGESGTHRRYRCELSSSELSSTAEPGGTAADLRNAFALRRVLDHAAAMRHVGKPRTLALKPMVRF